MVSFGNFKRSSPSSMSRGSNAILWSESCASIEFMPSLVREPGAGEERPEKELLFVMSGREEEGEVDVSPPPATLRRCSPEDILWIRSVRDEGTFVCQ
jgi:hypothetical protein